MAKYLGFEKGVATFPSLQWRRAKAVLDLGTGNGYYLGKLARQFPDKIYHGADLSAELIAMAQKQVAGGYVSFSHRDLFDVTGTFDFVLMRFLVQHVRDIEAVLEHVAGLTRPRGSALIVDADDSVLYFHPHFPEIMDFIAACAEREREESADRCVADRVVLAIASSAHWELGDALQLIIPSTIAGHLGLLTQLYYQIMDLVEHMGTLNYDFAALKDAWRRWAARPDAYTQWGMNLIRIDRAERVSRTESMNGS